MFGQEICDRELFSLFEASRWSPSSYNLQEWRFIYAKRNTTYWKPFFELLYPANQKSCSNASVLIILISDKYAIYKGKNTFNPYHSLDAGTAWMALALEASARGLAVLPMAGFDYTKAAEVIQLKNKNDYNIELMIAIGKKVPLNSGIDNGKVPFNRKVSQRQPIKKFVSEGIFIEKIHFLNK